jgi:hypothetical protein
MPIMDLQVVFQGGGAKLYALMAVCEVLKKYEEDRKILVTRAGGYVGRGDSCRNAWLLYINRRI